jgi:ATP-dependent helicase HrpA
MSIPEQIQQLSLQLPQCLNKDRHTIKRQLDRSRSEHSKGKELSTSLSRLSERIEKSIATRNNRAASVPVLEYPDLPICEKRDEIAQLIEKNQVVIICGETGSGKTTQLPKICLSIGQGSAGFIGHTQPRRIAARTVADRIAEELGESVGQTVGYKIRFQDKTREQSLIKLMTDGILLAESHNDPYLNQYDTIIIDEAHERSLNIDFLLGYMRWLLPRRPDLKLIITSATIDPQRFSRHFDNAPVIEVSGRTYPVDIRYRPIEQIEEDDETTADLQQAILDAVDELHRDMPGDILIFLSGEHEIRETTETLRKHNPIKCEILPLYAKLSVSEQERVFKPKGQRRIVLATNVAETSLTVPGIRSVIDSGHARISRYSHRSKIQRLPIERVSQASANQRAGRCGRVAEGICIRLYSEEDYLARSEFTDPEILRTHLSSVILQMSSLKLGDIEDFPFVESPDIKMIRDGKNSLHEVNALDKSGKLTDTGRRLAKLPTDPKLARMLLEADKQHCLTEVAIIVSALSIQDPREKPADKMQQADTKHTAFRVDDSDFLTLLNIWKVYEEQKKHLSNNKIRKYCRDNFLSYMRMREWHDIHSQIMQVIKGELKLKPNQVPASYEEIHRALLTGLLSNIGFKHEQYEYLGARNLKFFIFPGSGQHKVRPKWLMAAEQVETSKVYARNVAKIEPEWIEQAGQHLLKRSHFEPHWEKRAGRSAIYERTLLYGLTLQAKRKVPYERIDPVAARVIFIRSALVDQEYHTHAPFFKANRKLLEEVGYIQHKGRRVDLVEDEEWLYQFYEQKLPVEVVNGITLDKWRKQAEKENPQVLFLTKEDLTREQDHQVSERDYPDSMKVGNLTIALQYRFEPGHEEDGVTALIPVQQLNQISQKAFEWLVPGLLQEKLVALLKSLPKQLRKHFVPVPQTVERCLEIEPDAVGSLYEWLGTRLRKLTGEAIPNNAWNTEELIDHLRMNFRVIDENGKLLDFGRNLQSLQEKYAVKAEDSFDQLVAEEMGFTDCVQWVFDDLPETYQFMQKGQSFVGFPAIIDEGNSVGVRIIETQKKAEVLHRAGLVRLFLLQLKKESKYLLKNLPHAPDVELTYQRLTQHPILPTTDSSSYRDDLLHLMMAHVFTEGQMIRRQQEFEQSLSQHKNQLLTFANESGVKIIAILKQYAVLKKQLQKLPQQDEAVLDVTTQLNYLVYQGFFKTVPYESLKSYPRYLKAIEYRIEKMFQEPSKDQQKMQEARRFQKWFWDHQVNLSKNEQVLPEQSSFRWMLEEFRVSLFAQQLKTPYPVSAKRLEKAWGSDRDEGN